MREACLDVLDKDSQYYAVFKAKLVRVSSSNVRIEPKLPDGSYAEVRQVAVSPQTGGYSWTAVRSASMSWRSARS